MQNYESINLFGRFREAGVVFDVFVPRNKVDGFSRGLLLFVTRLNGMQRMPLIF